MKPRKKQSITFQYLISLALISTTAISCFLTVNYIGYEVVALILLLEVSLLAMFFDIFPVLSAAILSAMIWNFFFIQPIMTFHIGTPRDFLMFLMYFVIALINAVLTVQIRRYEAKARDKEERENTIKLYNTILNSLSHELRTPISAIIGSIDAIKENDGKLSKESIQELLNEIEIAGIRLDRQVENLLNMSRLEAGIINLQKDWCDVNELVYSVIKNNQTQNHRILFSANEKLPLFKIDRGLIEQVLHNLLHNAIQYTPNDSEISIEAIQIDGCCRFVISDRGKGFPEIEIQNVFEKFYRLPESSAGGTGLGLSIARGFTEAHRGTIALHNNKFGGATFTVTIPAETASLNTLRYEQS